MAQAPFLSTRKDFKGKYIVRDLFAKNYVSTGDDLFSRTLTSNNGRNGIFDTKEEALEAIEERKIETGRGLSLKEINKKYKKLSFKEFTQVYHVSSEIQKIVKPFKEHIGRSHLLMLAKGGYFHLIEIYLFM